MLDYVLMPKLLMLGFLVARLWRILQGIVGEISEIINNENLLRNYLSKFFLFTHFHVPHPSARPSSILLEYSLSNST